MQDKYDVVLDVVLSRSWNRNLSDMLEKNKARGRITRIIPGSKRHVGECLKEVQSKLTELCCRCCGCCGCCGCKSFVWAERESRGTKVM